MSKHQNTNLKPGDIVSKAQRDHVLRKADNAGNQVHAALKRDGLGNWRLVGLKIRTPAGFK